MYKLVGVETSDIVGSTAMSSEQLKLTMSVLKSYLANQQGELATVIEFYRGDAFQIMYPNAIFSFRHLLLTKLYMLSHLAFPVYITQSLALGQIDAPVSTLNDRMDSVFVHSGRQLSHVSKADIGLTMRVFSEASCLTLAFFNRIVQGLSGKQAEVLYWFIKHDFPEQKKIAALLGMTRQNVNTHLLRGNADLIKRFIMHIEACAKEQLR